MAAMFKPEEPSALLSPEREAARQLLNDGERSVELDPTALWRRRRRRRAKVRAPLPPLPLAAS